MNDNAVQPHKPDQDKVVGNDEVQQSRHNQDQNARDEGNDRRDVCERKGHGDLLEWDHIWRPRTGPVP